MDMPDPVAEYRRRLQARSTTAAAAEARSRRLSQARVATFTLLIAFAWLAYGKRLPAWTVALPAVAFVALVVAHDRADGARRRALRAVAYYDRGVARLDGRWRGTGEPGTRFLDDAHPYARDLDLFGGGSLFERLCAARTRAGEATLAGWLLAPSGAAEVGARQASVAELRERLDLREALALAGEDVRSEVDPAALARWGAAPVALTAGVGWAVAAVVSAASTTALVGWIATAWGWGPLASAAIVVAIVWSIYKDKIAAVYGGVDRPGRDLQVVSQLVALFEGEPFTSPRLRELQKQLHNEGAPASQRIARLASLIDWANAQRNQFFALFGALTLWPLHFAFAIERWRARSGVDVGRWLDVVGELEALASLAGYAYERPEDPFASVSDGEARLEATALGHPLIPDAECVRNDFRIGGALRLYVVSGSNMSGKSTMLRTVGINVVLALAGAPVRAAAMAVTPLQVGATLRIQDSLAEHASRFYAEITRIKQLVDLAEAGQRPGAPPLLFLIDEILAGTNSHDRKIGAEAVVRGLVERGAVGLVTTHDLALADVATALGARARNVHFEDKMVDGTLQFDYRMRDGVVQHSNAIALMRAVGLDV
jgi:hypothetical protein